MNDGFWDTLPRPFLTLAPMANVTDVAFRKIIAKYGKPDILWTEFVSADGLQSSGREKLLVDLQHGESERPIVAQIFGANPKTIERSAALIAELGFDGIDINMGCPDRAIEKQGAGAALIKNPTLAKEIILAAKEGATYARRRIPVSVKTRTGYNKNIVEEWVGHLLEAQPAAITLHARTRKEMSKGPADWDSVRRAVEVTRESARWRSTLIIGNGSVDSPREARERAVESGCDGVMLGSAIFGNPWLFANQVPDLYGRLTVMLEHARLFEELLGAHKNFSIMRKHFGAYARGFDGAAELREKLMKTENADEVEEIVFNHLSI